MNDLQELIKLFGPARSTAMPTMPPVMPPTPGGSKFPIGPILLIGAVGLAAYYVYYMANRNDSKISKK